MAQETIYSVQAGRCAVHMSVHVCREASVCIFLYDMLSDDASCMETVKCTQKHSVYKTSLKHCQAKINTIRGTYFTAAVGAMNKAK